MGFKNRIKPFVPRKVLPYARRWWGSIDEYSFDTARSVESAIRQNYGYDGHLLELFLGNKDNVVHKWHHYIPVYDRYFSRYRGQSTKFLEIGVSNGGSLQLWRKYLSEKASSLAPDIDKNCF